VDTHLPNHQREVVIAFQAMERYLTSGGIDAIETQDAFRALQRTYRGPSANVLDQFSSLNSPRQLGEWLARLRIALEAEIDGPTWTEVARREQMLRQTEEPAERLPVSRPDHLRRGTTHPGSPRPYRVQPPQHEEQNGSQRNDSP